MKRLIRSVWLAGLGMTLMPGSASAQMGAFIDWLHRLSGPAFVGVGASGVYETPGAAKVRLKLSGVYRTSVSESGEVIPATANITMLTFQPSVEFPLQQIPFDFGVGFALHRFGGDADGFWHYSVPIYAQFRPRGARRIAPLIGIGVHIFPKFELTDFAPLSVTASRTDSEAVLQLFAGISIRP
jgi:hypothetical protein